MEIVKTSDGLSVFIQSMWVGDDLSVIITGGDKPHIGAVALGTPCSDVGHLKSQSSTASVLVVAGHKEDLLARSAALQLAKVLSKTVVVSCGIHQENITLAQINCFNQLVEDAVEALIKEFL